MVAICISLVTSDVEHLFICLLANCISSLEKFTFLVVVELFLFFFLDVNPFLDDLQIFSLVLWVVFSLF